MSGEPEWGQGQGWGRGHGGARDEQVTTTQVEACNDKRKLHRQSFREREAASGGACTSGGRY